MKASQLLFGIAFACSFAPFSLAQSSVSVSVKRADAPPASSTKPAQTGPPLATIDGQACAPHAEVVPQIVLSFHIHSNASCKLVQAVW
jgi:hypothetical protein